MSHDVFISHASIDKPVADAICCSLEQKKVRCWMAPRDVMPGQPWASAIVKAISASKVMVLIISEAADQSSHVVREVELAASREVVIVPFRLSAVHLNESLEYFLHSPHWLDAITPPLEAHIDRLVEVVTRLIGPSRLDAPCSGLPVRVTVHLAYFVSTGTYCCFINVTNICRDVDVEVTHVWIDSKPEVHVHNPDRPLPKRLRPHETWETWVPLDGSNFGLTATELYKAARARISTGEVISSVRNETVPGEGVVPGGPIKSPP